MKGLLICADMPSLLVPDRDNLKRPGFEGANWQGIENGTFSVFSSDHCPLIYEEHEGGKKSSISPEYPNGRFQHIRTGVPGVTT